MSTCPAVRRYDPWAHVAEVWPEVVVVDEVMPGSLLGELRYPVIALRRDSSAAQRRCTLAHELVHLERGVTECGPWAAREEAAVHAEAARRLIGLDDLDQALCELGGAADIPALARALDVDRQTAALRLALLRPGERRRLRARSRQLSDQVA